ncbi:MAG TPA: FAD-dependent monooxygenase [Kaistiaceae bacterium]|nr:FAD-dependent monooxygenase [Kaistiaceae bacterium]
MAATRTIIIAGAGIGGLTAALMLARSGFRVAVLERARELSEVGAGIQLSPNALRPLYELGLGPALEAAAVRPERIEIRKASNARLLATIPLADEIERRHGAPYLVIHRADLQRILYEAACEDPDIRVELGVSFIDAVSHANGITVTADRDFEPIEYRGLGLIGADGVWSRVRRRVIGGPEPVYTQRTAWRATIPAKKMPAGLPRDATGLWLGREAHLVHYPISAGREINIVAVVVDDWQEEDWSAPGDASWLATRFEAWAEAPRELLSLPDRWLKWALCGVDPDFDWSDKATTLLGDAAHAMLPFLAQGGAMAIEDATVLARRLASAKDSVAEVFAAYEAERKPRVVRVVREAAENGRVYHWSGPAALARNMALRHSSPEKLISRYDWLYGWKA